MSEQYEYIDSIMHGATIKVKMLLLYYQGPCSVTIVIRFCRRLCKAFAKGDCSAVLSVCMYYQDSSGTVTGICRQFSNLTNVGHVQQTRHMKTYVRL